MESPQTAKKPAAEEDKAAGSSSAPAVSPDARYTFDEAALTKLRSESPWMKSPKFFNKVAVSPTAVARILMHCQSGCDKGIAKGQNPVEVMGMLLGRPDPTEPHSIVVTDAFPLPIEGFETRVIADDEQVVNHMIALGEALEKTRKERFCGWYHSHPFDLGDHSHCFLSQTDLSTQLQWQRAEDPHGNPFVAIVVDPLRSAHLENPQLKAFRAYPPEYTPPANECPDGTKIIVEQHRLELWGSCWNRYYELPVEYFMSEASRAVLESLTSNYLWIRTLTQSADTTAWTKACDCYQEALGTSSTRAEGNNVVTPRTTALHTAVDAVSAAARQQAQHTALQQVKDHVFGN